MEQLTRDEMIFSANAVKHLADIITSWLDVRGKDRQVSRPYVGEMPMDTIISLFRQREAAKLLSAKLNQMATDTEWVRSKGIKAEPASKTPTWQSIDTAPTDGTVVWVYTAARDSLPAFQGPCAYHSDAGWCTDELREVTHWVPLRSVYLEPPGVTLEPKHVAREELTIHPIDTYTTDKGRVLVWGEPDYPYTTPNPESPRWYSAFPDEDCIRSGSRVKWWTGVNFIEGCMMLQNVTHWQELPEALT